MAFSPKEISARYRARHPEKAREYAREYSRQWRKKNPEKAREAVRRWQKKNPEKVQENDRRWRENNRGWVNERARRWRAENLEKARARDRTPARRAARRKKMAELRRENPLLTLEWRQERRAFLDSLKDNPCVDCGEKFPPCAMDFDHVRGEKVSQVGNLVGRKKEIILLEIAKCDLVCANCHRIRTWGQKK